MWKGKERRRIVAVERSVAATEALQKRFLWERMRLIRRCGIKTRAESAEAEFCHAWHRLIRGSAASDVESRSIKSAANSASKFEPQGTCDRVQGHGLNREPLLCE